MRTRRTRTRRTRRKTRQRGTAAWREQVLEQLTRPAGVVDEVFQRIAGLTRALGFDYCSFGVRAPAIEATPQELWSTTYPTSWSTRYLGNNYLAIDPVIHEAKRRTTSFVWSDTTFAEQPAFWEEARACSVRHGWTLGMHGPRGETGLISLGRSAEPVSRAELDDIDGKLVWLAQLSHEVIGAMFLRDVLPELPALTERERDVLRWTAVGKTSQEIGVILGITTRTVTFHVTSLLRKLDAVNKTHAVAKAAMLRLL